MFHRRTRLSVCISSSGLRQKLSAVDYHLIKEAPIPSGGSLELIDGGSKVVMMNGDTLKAQASLTGSVDAIVSYIDSISE